MPVLIEIVQKLPSHLRQEMYRALQTVDLENFDVIDAFSKKEEFEAEEAEIMEENKDKVEIKIETENSYSEDEKKKKENVWGD